MRGYVLSVGLAAVATVVLVASMLSATPAAYAQSAAVPLAPPSSFPSMTFTALTGATAVTIPTGTLRFGTASDGCDLSWNAATKQLDELCTISNYATKTQVMAMVATTLPACGPALDGMFRRQSSDDAMYYCDGASWKPVAAKAQYRATAILPLSLGVLGVGGTSTSTVAVTGAPIGADCLATCPSGVATVGKVLVTCAVGAADVVTVVVQSLSALSLSLPTLATDRTCGVTVTAR